MSRTRVVAFNRHTRVTRMLNLLLVAAVGVHKPDPHTAQRNRHNGEGIRSKAHANIQRKRESVDLPIVECFPLSTVSVAFR